MKLIIKQLPWIVFGVMALYLVGKAMPPSHKEDKMDLYAFGQIPVQHNGRIQPIDSLARNTLVIITSGRQEYEHGQKSHQAIEWLLEVMGGRDSGAALPVFRIDDPDLRSWLGLPNKPGSYRYSIREINELRGKEMIKRAQSLRGKKPDQMSTFDVSLMTLFKHIDIFFQLTQLTAPGIVPVPDSDNEKWLTLSEINKTIEEAIDEEAQTAAMQDFDDDFKNNKQKYSQARDTRTPEEFRQWLDGQKNIFYQMQLRKKTDEARTKAFPQAQLFERILQAYERENVELFNKLVSQYHDEYVKPVNLAEVRKAKIESWMNHFEPFFLCKVLYIMVIVFAMMSWLVPAEIPLRRTAFLLACLTLGVHTGALIMRMFIGSRPPVTNLYSSAVFIGWGGLFLCLIMEVIYKNSLSTFVGGLLGFSTLTIAQILSQGGDTLEMLQAVLDTNFWLATHVTIVTLGYTATYVAGVLGIAYIVAGFFTNALRPDQGKSLYQMMYGTMCFATLLSFVGTVLGGIWADQSWGRFWGWDPKENGAVLIVIWNAMALHARWAGLVKGRGFAVMAVFGNSVTTWSWFGTNQLGIGLHAYGFNNTLALTCVGVWIVSTMFMILGLMPQFLWASFSKQDKVV